MWMRMRMLWLWLSSLVLCDAGVTANPKPPNHLYAPRFSKEVWKKRRFQQVLQQFQGRHLQEATQEPTLPPTDGTLRDDCSLCADAPLFEKANAMLIRGYLTGSTQ